MFKSNHFENYQETFYTLDINTVYYFIIHPHNLSLYLMMNKGIFNRTVKTLLMEFRNQEISDDL